MRSWVAWPYQASSVIENRSSRIASRELQNITSLSLSKAAATPTVCNTAERESPVVTELSASSRRSIHFPGRVSIGERTVMSGWYANLLLPSRLSLTCAIRVMSPGGRRTAIYIYIYIYINIIPVTFFFLVRVLSFLLLLFIQYMIFYRQRYSSMIRRSTLAPLRPCDTQTGT